MKDVVYRRCCGLDVHKDTIAACVRWMEETGESCQETRVFGTRNGNAWLRRALCEAGWAAGRSKNTYLSAQFRRLAARRGVKRATMAVGHSILIIAYHMLKDRRPYQDLGGGYFDRLRGDGLKRYYVKRLQQLGLTVQVQPAAG